MVHTAIIVFILIGTMFLFSECGNKENTHGETTKLESQALVEKKTPAEIKAKEEADAIAKERARAAAESERIKRGRLEAEARAEQLARAKIEAKIKAEEELENNKTIDTLPNVTNTITTPISKDNNSEVNITIPSVPEVVSVQLNVDNNEMITVDDSNVNLQLKKALEKERDKEEALEQELEKFKAMLDMSENEAKDYREHINLEVKALVEERSALKDKLTMALKDKKKIGTKNTDLEEKIIQLLSIAKNGTQKAELEFNSLLSTKTSLENNLTEHLEYEKTLELENTKLASEESELKNKIGKLLAIAKEGTEKGQMELDSLLAAKESLENNLTEHLEYEKTLELENTKLASEESELKNKIGKLLAIAKEGTEKGQMELDSLLAAKESLENNLTEHLEYEKTLELENTKLASEESELKNKINELSVMEKESKQKAKTEFAALLLRTNSLVSDLSEHSSHEKALELENAKLLSEESELKNKMNQLSTAKEEAEKVVAEAKAKEEAEKAAAKAKAKEEAEKAAAEAKAKEEAEKAAAEAKAKEEAEKAAAEAKAKEEAEKAAAEAKAKEEAEKAAAEAKAKEEAEKAAAEAKAKEEAEKAAAEAKAKEEAEKAAAEAKAKEEAEKAAAEAKAKEEAEKAAAEAKAKEEAEKAAAEAKAKEEAEKAAAEAKAKEAESKLMGAFSLTKVAFRAGSMQLTTASRKRLDVAIDTMKKYEGYSYKIQGHTDNIGKEKSNLLLSSRRAESVKNYLVSKGIDENILSVEGFGSSQPIASNDTKRGREANRRVVFQIVK